MAASKTLARSSLQTIAMLGVRVLTQALMLTAAVRLLGPTLYGSLTAATSLALVLGIVPNMGAGFVLMRRMALRPDAPSDVWSYAWPMQLALGLALLALYLGVCGAVTGTAFMPLVVVAVIGTTEILLTPLTAQLSMTLQAIERVPLSQFLQWVPLFLRLCALPLCMLWGEQVRAQVFVLTQWLGSLLGLIVAWRITGKYVDLGRKPRKPTAEELRSGAAYALLSLIALNSVEIDKIGAVHSVGPHDAGVYASASRIISAGTLPLIGLLMSAQPRLFRHAQVSQASLRQLVLAILVACAGYSALAMIALILGTSLLVHLFGPAFRQLSELLPLMSAIVPLQGMRLAAANVMVALGRPARRIWFDGAGIGMLLVLMFWLGPRYGPTGLALSVAVTEGVLALSGWYIVWKHLSGLGITRKAPACP